MSTEVGLRERKKRQTRQQIFEAARRLFDKKGFDAVTVAEVAREADVSEVTVFNYFPTKEDLFYGGMQFFEEQLLEAVRSRPSGESAANAFGRRLLASTDGLGSAERVTAILRSGKVVGASPSLVDREREVVESYAQRLGAILAEETGSRPGDIEPLAVAWALIAAHRTVVAHVRDRVRAGVRGEALVKDARAQVRRVMSRLDRGLADYAVKARPKAGAERFGDPGGRDAGEATSSGASASERLRERAAQELNPQIGRIGRRRSGAGLSGRAFRA